MSPMLGRLILKIFRGSLPNNALESTKVSVDEILRLAYTDYRSGKYADAKHALSPVAKNSPAHAEVLWLLGEIENMNGDQQVAADWFHQAASAPNTSIDLFLSIANQFALWKNFPETFRILKQALKQYPLDARLVNQLGLVLLEAGNLQGAEERFKLAVNYDKHYPDPWNNLGIVAQRRGDFRTACEYFRQAIAIDPNYPTAQGNLGLSLRELQKPSEALAYLQHAVNLDPANAGYRLNLGILLADMEALEDAQAQLIRATEIAPKMADIYVALGNTLYKLGQRDDAVTMLEKALNLDSNNAEAQASLGEIELASGNFSEGWAHYEFRLAGRESPRQDYPYKLWEGDDLQGKTLLVYGEQGLGDTILFASCIPDVLQKAAGCVLVCDPRLATLFQRAFPEVLVVAHTPKSPLPIISVPVDACVAIGSLPRYFRTHWSDFPSRPYLHPEPERVHYWREKLDSLGYGQKVGVSWRGGLVKTGRAARSLELNKLMPLLRLEGAHFISLQYSECAQELLHLREEANITVHQWPQAVRSLEETAALMCALDLTVTVCNTNVHLGGAMGAPVWVLVPANPAWRYLLTGDRLPWYESVRLLRQAAPSVGWGDVVHNLVQAFKARFLADNK